MQQLFVRLRRFKYDIRKEVAVLMVRRYAKVMALTSPPALPTPWNKALGIETHAKMDEPVKSENRPGELR